MTPAQEQFARLTRFLHRLERQGATDDDRDDVMSFFLHAWHLTDWAANDPTVASDLKAVRDDVKKVPSIAACEDIANGAKHLVLDRPPRLPPRVTHEDIRDWDGGPERPAEASFTYTLANGSQHDALQLARQIVADWRSLLERYGVRV